MKRSGRDDYTVNILGCLCLSRRKGETKERIPKDETTTGLNGKAPCPPLSPPALRSFAEWNDLIVACNRAIPFHVWCLPAAFDVVTPNP